MAEMSAIPQLPISSDKNTKAAIKFATPDIIQVKEEQLPVELMTSLIFEDIGGQELITIARNDIVNGQTVAYNPIKNLSDVALKYNPYNIIAIADTSSSYFKNYAISLSSHIPETKINEQTGLEEIIDSPEPSGSIKKQIAYIDQDSGDLVINVIGMKNEEQVEISVLSFGSSFDDTIYGAG